MDSRPIGSDTLLYIDTGKVRVTVSGPFFQPSRKLVKPYSNKDSRVAVYCKDRPFVFARKSSDDGSDLSVNGFEGSIGIIPLFFEQTTYQIHVETDEGNEVEIWHASPNIRNQIRRRSIKYPVYDGAINFQNDVGYSEFSLKLNGRDYLRFIIEVFPEKIDYKLDYQALLADVTKETYSLIFDYLRKTYREFGLSNGKSTLLQFFNIISTFFSSFIKSLNMVLSAPAHNLVTVHEVLPSYKIRKTDQRTLKWLYKHPEEMNGSHNIHKALGVRKNITYDTNENRLIRFMLESVYRRLKDFADILLETKADEDNGNAVVNKAHSMMGEIRRRLDFSFLKDIKAMPSSSSMSLVFAMAPGYRDLYKYYLELLRVLSIEGNVFHASLKDVAVLYEYWCFIKLGSLLKNKYELVGNSLFKVRRNGISVNLTKGKESELSFHKHGSNEAIRLFYNYQEPNAITTVQKPDNILSLTKSETGKRYEYVFDAKYRIDVPGTSTDQYDSSKEDLRTPGPVLDTINTMHRYRDSILASRDSSSPMERKMFGAYVLFPYSNEREYRNHHFYKSIEKVNIGGLPFLPGATEMVSSFLDGLISESDDSAFGRAILPNGIDDRLEKVSWKRDVMIGGLRDRSQYEYCIRHNRYYAPAFDRLNQMRPMEKDLPVHYVALYQSERQFPEHPGIYKAGEVIRCYRCKRKEIPDLLSNPYRDDDLYYVFELNEWKDLNNPILKKELGIRSYIFTTQYLMDNARDVPDLYIEDARQWKVYRELRRKSQDELVLSGKISSSFSVSDFSFVFEHGMLSVYDVSVMPHKIPYQVRLDHFGKHPKDCFEGIKKTIGL